MSTEMDWSSIHHRTVTVDEPNNIKLHIAERGEGNKEVVLFLHGFPDLWYCWRHQIVRLGDDYHAVAPDLRGYGHSSAPEDVSSYTIFQIAGDIISLMDNVLNVKKVYLVAHDWGAIIGWYLCMFRPDRIQAYICLSVPFRPFLGRDPQQKPVDYFREKYGDNFYLCRFQEVGEMERELDDVDRRTLMTSILISHSPGPATFPDNQYWPGFNLDYDPKADLPPWFQRVDADYYTQHFKGFTGPLNYYRALDYDWELTAQWTKVGVNQVPVKFITGNKGLLYTLPGVAEYIHNGAFKKDVALLDPIITVYEGAAHFGLPQEKPVEVGDEILKFIAEHKMCE